jgi:branched-chain amino acid transport system ATP-binding protein
VTALTDRNLVLVKGRVVAQGSAAELKREPQILQRYLGI